MATMVLTHMSIMILEDKSCIVYSNSAVSRDWAIAMCTNHVLDVRIVAKLFITVTRFYSMEI